MAASRLTDWSGVQTIKNLIGSSPIQSLHSDKDNSKSGLIK